METAKGMSADVYLTLDAYLEAVVPQIDRVRWAASVDLAPGLNVMDLTALNVEMQHLVIRSTDRLGAPPRENTVVVMPEAWKFIPQGRGTPVKLAAESYIRQAAGLRNFLWLDSQDIAGVEKIILKSVPLWILGVQREANEVKRTLDQIPAGIRKPKPPTSRRSGSASSSSATAAISARSTCGPRGSRTSRRSPSRAARGFRPRPRLAPEPFPSPFPTSRNRP
jgi:hypothetical protein